MSEEVKRKRGRPRKEESVKGKTSSKSLQEVVKEKSERKMEGIAYWASFYRKNPQRFAKEYLNINLKLFQKILLYVMMWATNFIYIAARG